MTTNEFILKELSECVELLAKYASENEMDEDMERLAKILWSLLNDMAERYSEYVENEID